MRRGQAWMAGTSAATTGRAAAFKSCLSCLVGRYEKCRAEGALHFDPTPVSPQSTASTDRISLKLASDLQCQKMLVSVAVQLASVDLRVDAGPRKRCLVFTKRLFGNV